MHECAALSNEPDKTQIKSEPTDPVLPGFSTPTCLSALHLHCLFPLPLLTFTLAPKKASNTNQVTVLELVLFLARMGGGSS